MIKKALIIALVLVAPLYAYIETIKVLRNPDTKQLVFVGFDDHYSGSIEDNDAQADDFIRMLSHCAKRLKLSNRRMKVLCESVYFYDLLNTNDLSAFKGLNLAAIGHKQFAENTQTTWISWQLPMKFLENLHQGAVSLRSVDPRMILLVFREILSNAEEIEQTSDASFKKTKYLAKNLTFQAIVTIYDVLAQKLLEAYERQNSDDRNILKLIENFMGLINKEKKIFMDIIKKYFTDQQHITSSNYHQLILEAHDEDFQQLLVQKHMENDELLKLLKNLLYDDLFLAISVDILSLIEIIHKPSPYNFYLLGNAHAKTLIENLKNIGFEEITMANDDGTEKTVDDMMNCIPGMIEISDKSHSMSDLFVG